MDEQPQPQPDVGDSDMAACTETPDAAATRRTRTLTKRSDPAVPNEGRLKKMRIWSKHSHPLTPAVVSEQPEKRSRIPAPASVNPETFAMMLEADGNLETYTELNAVALDLHEPDPETTWSSDLGWVLKSILQEAREKEVTKLQQFGTYEEVPQAEAEGQEIISSRFVDKMGRKWRTEISLGFARLRFESGGPRLRSLSLHLRSWRRELRSCWDWHRTWKWQWRTFMELFVPPAEYRKPGVVWMIKRYLNGDKRAPLGWQDHFDKTMLELGFERLESEPGCFVKKGVSHKDTIIVVVHVDDLLSVPKRKHLDNFFVQLEKTLKLKCIEFIENGKSVLFLGDCITKFKDKITLKSKDAHVDDMLTLMGMESCQPTSTPMVRKESAANGDAEMLEGSEAWTCRSVVGLLTYLQETPFRLALRGKVPGKGEFLADQGSHETSETSFALHSRNARHASGIGSVPRTGDGNGWLV